MNNFNKCIDRILFYEGGYINDPDDTGGETYRGVSRNNWPNWEGWITIDKFKKDNTFPACLNVIETLQLQVAKFYKANFWDDCNLDLIENDSKALQIFDFAVNAGVVTSIKLAQAIVNTSQDGKLGPITAQAINKEVDFITPFIDSRIEYYKGIVKKQPKKLKYLTGWVNRAKKAIF